MKKLLALLICLLMLVFLVACGGDADKKTKDTVENSAETELKDTQNDINDDSENQESSDENIEEDNVEQYVSDPLPEDLIGIWKGSISFDEVINSLLGMELTDTDSLDLSFLESFRGLSLDMNVEFNENNTARAWYDEEQITTFIESMVSLLVETYTNPEYYAMLNDMSIEEATQEIESMGMTPEEYKELISTMFTADTIKDMIGTGEETSEFYIMDTDIVIISENGAELWMSYENGVLQVIEEETGLFAIVFEKQ